MKCIGRRSTRRRSCEVYGYHTILEYASKSSRETAGYPNEHSLQTVRPSTPSILLKCIRTSFWLYHSWSPSCRVRLIASRWKEAVRNRKWPYRTISKLDKEIMTLLHNIPQPAVRVLWVILILCAMHTWRYFCRSLLRRFGGFFFSLLFLPQGPGEDTVLPAEIEATLGHLLRKRLEELRSVVIRINWKNSLGFFFVDFLGKFVNMIHSLLAWQSRY